MADTLTAVQRSHLMSRVRSRGNETTELRMITILRAGHITGWRRGVCLIGKPDFTFRRERVVVFIDGCFWHGCRWHFRLPESNRHYWNRKIHANIKRDRKVTRSLQASRWCVLRFWEHSLADESMALRRITRALERGRRSRHN